MPQERTSEKPPPKDVGHVSVEVVGVDDLADGTDPNQPPRDETARVLASVGFLVVPIAVFALVLTTRGNDHFLRAAALQSVVLWTLTLILFVIPCVGTPFVVLGLLVAAYGAVMTWQGNYVKLPVIWPLVRRFV